MLAEGFGGLQADVQLKSNMIDRKPAKLSFGFFHVNGLSTRLSRNAGRIKKEEKTKTQVQRIRLESSVHVCHTNILRQENRKHLSGIDPAKDVDHYQV